MTKTQPSLTLSLLQAREAAMAFFRPLLNQHDLTEQQWRVIRILKPSMTGVLGRLERDGLVRRQKAAQDQRRVFVSLTEGGEACFASMKEGMEANYQKIQAQFGEEKLQQLMGLLNDLKRIAP